MQPKSIRQTFQPSSSRGSIDEKNVNTHSTILFFEKSAILFVLFLEQTTENFWNYDETNRF